MAQQAKIIDISKSYLPGDPNTFPMNLGHTQREDQPLEMLPVIPIDLKNMLPSSYGYRSYFGTTPVLGVAALTTPCNELLLYQTEEYENVLIALCSDGIYKLQGAALTWTKSVAYTDTWTTLGVYEQYTHCIIENTLYIYRQGAAKFVKIIEDGTLSEVTPTFLNMTGQMGIFKANGRLGFWDSEDSVAWSSAFDLSDFTPALETMAGNAIFLAVKGRIVTILDHGDGFVIYATRSVTGVAYTTTGTLTWDASSIIGNAGVAHAKAVCYGETEKQHIVWTSNGIFTIGNQNIVTKQFELQPLVPELYDYLKESKDPIYMKMLAGRYLHFGLINPNYLDGIVLAEVNTLITQDAGTCELVTQLGPETNTWWPSDSRYWTDNTGIPWYVSSGDKNLAFSTDYADGSNPYSFAVHGTAAWSVAYNSEADYDIGKPFVKSGGFWYGDHTFKFELYFNKQDAYYAEDTSPASLDSNIFLPWSYNGISEVAYPARIEVGPSGTTFDFYFSLVHTYFAPTNTWHKALSGLAFNTWHEITIKRLNGINYITVNTSVQSYSVNFGLPASLVSNIEDPPQDRTAIEFTRTYVGYPWVVATDANPYHYIRNIEFYIGDNADTQVWPSTLLVSIGPSNDIGQGSPGWTWTDETGYAWLPSPQADGYFSTNFASAQGPFSIAMQPGPTKLTDTGVANDRPFTRADGFWSGPHTLEFELYFDKLDATRYVPVGTAHYQNANIYLLRTTDDLGNMVGYPAWFTVSEVGDSFDMYLSLTHSVDNPNGNWVKVLESLPFYTWNRIIIKRNSNIVSIETDTTVEATEVNFGLKSNLSSRNYEVNADTVLCMSFNLPLDGYPQVTATDLRPYHYVRNVNFYVGLDQSVPPYWSYPPVSWLLQNGVPVSGYPTFAGSLVFDVQLKKWGKFVGQHRALVHLAPGNETSEAIIPYSNFGVDSGIVGTDGTIRLFDVAPSTSEITFGRIGLSRMGFTEVYEVTAHFRMAATGTLSMRQSIDGKLLTADVFTETFTAAESCTLYLDTSAKWYTITISGNFDLTYLEFRGNLSSRR